jgi:hypothetical protein
MRDDRDPPHSGLNRLTRSNAVTVDIGIPTLGASRFLRDAVESVLAQTFTSWRLTISENGSPTEELRAVLAPYLKDGRIRHTVVGDLVSMSANWTRAADGEAKYLTLLHDDDRWDDEFLERRVAFLETHPTCGFVFGGFRYIDESGASFRTIQHDLPPGVIERHRFLQIVYENCIVAPPTGLIRREAYDAVGRFAEVFHCDHDMWIRLSANADVGYLSVADSEYRYHDTQTTTQRRTRIGAAQLEVIEATKSLPIEPSVRRRTAAKAQLLAALDSVELGERRVALGYLGSAVRTQPSLLIKPSSCARILLALAATMSGERGRRRFLSWRAGRFLQRTGR